MKKVKLYYPTFQVEMELSEQEHIKLLRKWQDSSNRGGNTQVITKFGSQFDIDLTFVQLVETEKQA